MPAQKIDSLKARMQAVAQLFDGRPVAGSNLQVNLRGSVMGFPASLRAFQPGWPFGVDYIVETEVVADPSHQPASAFTMSLYPRAGRGLFNVFTRLFLFEGSGLPVGEKHLEAQFVISYNDRTQAERFAKYPGVREAIESLYKCARFSEMQINSQAGISLSVPTSFNNLDLDRCRETFRLLGQLAQIIFEAF